MGEKREKGDIYPVLGEIKNMLEKGARQKISYFGQVYSTPLIKALCMYIALVHALYNVRNASAAS